MEKDAKPTSSQVDTLRGYLETHFPERVGADRWDGDRYAQIFEVYHDSATIRVVVVYEFFREIF